jgi:hypothetical protein
VTAELALAMPTLILVLVVGLWLQSAVALQARCLDAARAGARAAARGDSDAQIRVALAEALPAGADIGIGHAGDRVTVTVRTAAPVPPGLSSLVGGRTMTASATAAVEEAFEVESAATTVAVA